MIPYVQNINVQNTNGNNVLMSNSTTTRNVRLLNLQKVKLLLDCKIDLNVQNNRGETVLMNYCANIRDDPQRYVEALELLVHRGADISIKSNIGKTAYDYITNVELLPERLVQLLRGTIVLNRTKRATQ